MIGTKKRQPLSPEAMQALAELPQLGLGSAPPPMPSQADSFQAPLQPAGPAPQTAVDLSGLGAPTKLPESGGFLSKMNDILKQPGMSAALLRSAGATLDGGLGAGIAAGTSFMDRRRIEDERIRQNALENGLRNRLAANTERATTGTLGYQQGQLALGRDRNAVSAYGIDRRSADSRYGVDAGVGNNMRSNQTSMANAALASDTSLATNANSVAATYAGQRQSDVNSRRSLQGTMLTRGPSGPKVVTQIKRQVPTVTSDADYENLDSGTQFVGPDGTIRIKP